MDNTVDAAHVRDLPPGEPGCLVVVTSRSDLSGLGSRAGVFRLGVDVLGDRDAAELFESVARGHRDLGDPVSRAEIVRLCARLPLAPRIAAGRAVTFPDVPYAEIVAQLRDESRLWDALSMQDAGEAADVRALLAFGRTEQALDAAREALQIGENLESDVAIARALIELGRALRAAGDPDAAVEVFHRALTHQGRRRHRSRTSRSSRLCADSCSTAATVCRCSQPTALSGVWYLADDLGY